MLGLKHNWGLTQNGTIKAGKRPRPLRFAVVGTSIIGLLLIRVVAGAQECPQNDLGSTLHATILGTTVGAAQALGGSCGGQNAPEVTFTFSAPIAGDYVVDTDDKTATSFDSVLYVLDSDCTGMELACNDNIGGAGQLRSRVRVSLAKGQRVVVVVDGMNQAGSFALHVNRDDVSVDAGFVVAHPGDAVVFAVTLNSGGSAVADVDNILSFDPINAPIAANGGLPDCQIGSGLNKEASSFSFLPDGCSGTDCRSVRAHITSALNRTAIPDGAIVYSCQVQVPLGATPRTYPLLLTDVKLTDPDGATIPETQGGNGEVVVQLAQCGNGVVEAGEDCDDGGLCIGGTNAGTGCSSDGDCHGSGSCEAGPRVGAICENDTDCPGSRCLRCKTFGGDGCAANCTSERDIPYNLVPGMISDFSLNPGTSGAQFLSSAFNVSLPLEGNQTLTIGRAGIDGAVPFVLKANSVHLPKVSALGLSCACIRAVPLKTCGGTLFEADGTASPSCTPGFPSAVECPTEKPCAFVHGPGNAATGVLGCGNIGLRGVNFTLTQDAAICIDPPTCAVQERGPVHVVTTANGLRGSARLISSTAIGLVSGACQPDFCSDSDPIEVRGVPTTVPLTTGQAQATVLNTGGVAGLNIGPAEIRGSVVDCDAALQDPPDLSNFAVVAAFPLLDDVVIGDSVITTRFVAQGAPPTATATEIPTLTATPSETPTQTATQIPTESPTPTETATLTLTPSETPTVLPSETPTETATEQPTSTATETPSPTGTATTLPTNSPEPSPTATLPPTEIPSPTETIRPTSTAGPTATHTVMPPCAGDCDGNGEVTIDELLVLVNIALETREIGACTPGDTNGDGAITIEEILLAVNRALGSCFEASSPLRR
ncbi:MAG: hypothetical protein HY270_19635 [Deltaproteobacteria bacterium]|nr:hypothetical protein [Deltaproteobacteria bacterium]